MTALAVAEDESAIQTLEEPSPNDVGRRRFTIAIFVGLGIVLLPYLFVLWALWSGSVNPFRGVGPSDFYDLQAQAIAHGHLYVKTNSLGIEGFIHNGHTYTYFGIFPSLIRFPVLAFASFLSGYLTAPSILLAWLLTAFFGSLLLWRVRVLVRGNVEMGWTEAVSCGALMAVMCGGSALVYLAANPWVYDEDLAWSVALMTGVLFALIGVMDRPSMKRVAFAGLLILCADLNRLTTGWACVIGAFLVASWFALGKGGKDRRHWAVPMLAAGLIPLAVGGIVTWMKFGNPFSLPLADQVWTQVNPHRRVFLKANGGKGFSLKFLPTTFWAYMKPGGVSLSSIFPYVTGPTTPPKIVGDAIFDQIYPTASIPASMPLLFILSAWGLITAFRRHSIGLVRLTRLPLLATIAATGGVLLWGYIADRYLADFLPLLFLASIVGLVDLTRRVVRRSRRVRLMFVATVLIVGIFSVVANVGTALVALNSWTTHDTTNFLDAQGALSIGNLSSRVEHGPKLPYYAPTGQLFNVADCSGLYFSTGFSYKYSIGQQLQHKTWIPIEQSAGINHFLTYESTGPLSFKGLIPLLTYGKISVALLSTAKNRMRVVIVNPPPASSFPAPYSPQFEVKPHHLYFLSIMTDPYLNSLEVRGLPLKHAAQIPSLLGNGVEVGGGDKVSHFIAGFGPAKVLPPPSQGLAAKAGLTLKEIPAPIPSMSRCHSLG